MRSIFNWWIIRLNSIFTLAAPQNLSACSPKCFSKELLKKKKWKFLFKIKFQITIEKTYFSYSSLKQKLSLNNNGKKNSITVQQWIKFSIYFYSFLFIFKFFFEPGYQTYFFTDNLEIWHLNISLMFFNTTQEEQHIPCAYICFFLLNRN